MNDSEQSFVSSLLTAIERLRSLSQIDILTDWRMSLGCGSLAADTHQWDRVSLNEKGQIAWELGRQEIWLAQTLIIPTQLQGYPVAGLICRLAFTWWAELAQVFVDGVLVQEGDLFDHSPRVVLMPTAVPGTSIDLRVRLISPGHDIGALMRSKVVYESTDPANPEPGWLADELAVMVKQVESFDPARLGELAVVIEAIDYDLLVDSRQFIQAVVAIKQRVKSLSTIHDPQSTIQLLGHAHLDMAWLWEVAETWEVADRTFRSALKLQHQFPELTFCHSTPALYEWMEINQPEVFAAIFQQVRLGKWEIVGGMWIEPDLNLISGESIARQIIYGQKYNQAKFGEVTKVSWLPDTFGFCNQLPQLLKQGGIDYFVTQKFLWNDTNQFPHQLFWWESPDGSQVLSLMSSPIGEGIDPLKMIDYACKWQTATGINESLYLFGVGDHGGGPTRDMLEIADRWSQSDVFPNLEFTTAVKYLDQLACRADSQSLPVWKDELYLEFHRGCFTTHADQKRSNRQCEDLLYQAELWSSLACIINDRLYPDDLKLQIKTAWKQTLFNQFHDIIPGTAIEPVYITANDGWLEVERVTTQIISNALGNICDRINIPTPPVEGAMPIVIFNALNWMRNEVIEYPLDSKETRLSCLSSMVGKPNRREPLFEKVGFMDAWQVFDADGELVPSQLFGKHILFLATDLPSVGYRLFWIAPNQTPIANPLLGGVPEGRGGSISETTQSTSEFILQNQFVTVTINPETGDIDSIYDILNDRQILSSTGGNQLQAFQDGGQYWDAWNIDPKYAEKPLSPSVLKSHGSPSAPAIEWRIVNGAVRQSIRVVRELAGCDFTQDYILDAHSPIVRIETSVDWQAEHVLIKANFPLNLTADISTAETACGAIDRPTIPQTPAEKAKWELPMHRWVDLTDRSGKYGVSILNDCKYGYDAGSDFLRLTLLRSSNWPDPIADRGYHEFTYAIYPHNGSWQAAQTVRRGLELNSPLQVVRVDGGWGDGEMKGLGASRSLIDLEAENLVIMAFKPAENPSESWVLRCYECHGIESEIVLTGDLDLGIDRVVNLLEEPVTELVDSMISMISMVKPWQIRSFGIVNQNPKEG
jgi:alpha-mannosidase